MEEWPFSGKRTKPDKFFGIRIHSGETTFDTDYKYKILSRSRANTFQLTLPVFSLGQAIRLSL